ncbi:MAG: glycosyltransferase [Pseudomonadota bacterium]
MHFLWLTLAEPDPATNGQLIYSKGLIDAVRKAGASLRVIGLARRESTQALCDAPGIEWRLADEHPRRSWNRFLSPLPVVAQRGDSADMKRLVDAAFDERSWDAVVFDSICSGWALARVLDRCRRGGQRPRLVYLAHNHELTVSRHIAGTARGLRRIVKSIDGVKVQRLEQNLVHSADLVTANTPEDCRLFAAQARCPVEHLPPGYDGTRLERRTIDAKLPRRAIVVSSLDWPPKRFAVESFLEAGAAMFAQAGIELQIVGEAEPAYLAGLRQRFPTVQFVGRVDDVRPFMRQARLALVPDVLGGFKLKGLDYVFHRLPILALRSGLPGMPLVEGQGIGLFDDHAALARGVLAIVDDLPRLNAWQETAYAACADCFDWSRIGRHLLEKIGQETSRRVTGATSVPPFSAASQTVPLSAGR